MRLLFVHDHRFYQDKSGAVYTAGSLPAKVWDRYLAKFDTVHVVGRGSPLPARANYALSSRTGVTFELVPNVSYAQMVFGSNILRQRILSAVARHDAVVVRLPSEMGFMAAAACHKAGKVYAVELVGCAWDAMRNQGSWKAWFYAPLMYFRTRHALRRSPLTLYVTSRWLQRRYATRGKAYAASDVEIAPLSPEQLLSRKSRIREIAAGQAPELGTVASLRIRSKGIQTAIAALEVLRNEGFEFRYRVLGGGDASPWIALCEKHGVADLVAFDGVRPAGEGVRQWLDTIDIHLQPSFQEGLPRATVEAMSRGAACVGSTCGGIPELLPPERLHEPGDVGCLADRIRRLATDPRALAETSARDLETAQYFRPERLAAIRSEFLGELRAAADKAR
jgi:glycosyltransferase involved in cell wall biosynthesis